MKNNIKYLSLLFILFSILNSTFAQNKGGNYTGETVAAGEWTNAANWNQTTAPDPSSKNCDLTFYHDITYNPTGTSPWTNPFIWKNNITLLIKSNVTVTMNSDIDIQNNFDITIEPGGQFIINGNIHIKNNVDGTIDGSMYVTGDLTVDGNGNSGISGNGELVVDGTITDDNNVIDPNLLSGIHRWLIVDNGNWNNKESWSSSCKGPVATSVPNKQCIVHIDTSYTGYLNITGTIAALDIKPGGKLILNPTKTLTVLDSISNSGELEINSDATGTGGLIFNGTSSVSATCKRYVSANEYHYVSSPMTAAPVSSYNVTSSGYTNPNFYYYDETELNADWMYGWKQANSGNLELGKGYALYTDENYAYSLQGGVLQNQNFDYTITNTTGAGGSKSWNLIGNPFPCNIVADTFINVNDDASVFTGSLYFWDDDGSNGGDYDSNDYLVYTKGGGTTNGPNGGVSNGIIAPLQAFFVQADAGGDLTFSTDSKTATSGNFVKSATKNSSPDNKLKILRLSLSNNKGLYNDILIKFADDASEEQDIYDGLKLRGNKNIAFFTMLNGDEYAIQGFPSNFKNRTVDLAWEVNVSGTYTIKAEDFINLDKAKIFLLDKETGSLINLRNQDYTFETFGKVTDRISIIFFNPQQSVANSDDFDVNKPVITTVDKKILINGNTKPAVISIYDLSGKLVLKDELTGNNKLVNLNESSGWYIVSISNNFTKYDYKIFIN